MTLLPLFEVSKAKSEPPVGVRPEYWEFQAGYDYVDQNFKNIIGILQAKAVNGTNDNVLIYAGPVNSGKSTLAHHAHHLYTEGDIDLKRIAFDQNGIADVMLTQLGSHEVKDRVCHFDEFNLSRRRAMTRWNQDIIDLYFSIRSDRGFHLWCNPSVDMLDMKFIEERVTAVIYIFDRGEKGIRRYHIIAKQGITTMVRTLGNLKQATIEKLGHKYAVVRNGWFRDYPNLEFKNSYEALKDARNLEKRGAFFKKYGEKAETFTMADASKQIGLSAATLADWLQMYAKDKGRSMDSFKGVNGRFRLSAEEVMELKTKIPEWRLKGGGEM